MRTTLLIIGILLCVLGAVWFLQGINVLPGSFMTGQTQWAVYGGMAVVAGLVLVLRARRRPPPSHAGRARRAPRDPGAPARIFA